MNDIELLRDCLALRRHTLRLFSGNLEPEAWVRLAAATQPRAFWLFFAAEACASPVKQRVGTAAHLLPDEQRRLLERASGEELQRVLAARAQLAVVDRAAAMAGVTPVLLKGAVPIAEAKSAFDLGDIDLLLDEAGCESMARALRALGGEGQSSVHFPDAFHVELHSHLDVGHGVKRVSRFASRAIPGYARLRRLENVDHIAYIIQHTTTHHPHRRSNLRDLMLLADAIRDCSARELDELTALLRASRERELYLQTLSSARAMAAGRLPEDVHRTTLIAAANYAFGLRWPTSVGPVQHLVRGMVTFFFGPASDVARAVRIYLLDRTTPSSYWLRHPFARRAPRASMLASYIIRTPYRVAMLLFAATTAMAFRLDFDRHLQQPTRAG